MEKVLASLMKDDRFRLHRPGRKVSYSAALELVQFSLASSTSHVLLPQCLMSDSVNNYRTTLYHNFSVFCCAQKAVAC